jgi:hypothetical protein
VPAVTFDPVKTFANRFFRAFQNLRKTALMIQENARYVVATVSLARHRKQTVDLVWRRPSGGGADIENTQHAAAFTAADSFLLKS